MTFAIGLATLAEVGSRGCRLLNRHSRPPVIAFTHVANPRLVGMALVAAHENSGAESPPGSLSGVIKGREWTERPANPQDGSSRHDQQYRTFG
jgi:hypothetical protein